MSDLSINPVKDAALRYIHDGHSVVPIKLEYLPDRGKKPALESLKEYQTRIPTETEANEWFSNDNQVAIMCGCVSGNLVVFDFDGEKWDELLTEFITLFPELQNTRIVRTGSFKTHIYVRCTELPEEVTRIVRSFPDRGEIELRANKHYVLAPPSIHPSGNQYEFCNPETPILVISHERLTEVINWLNESRRVAPAPQVNQERVPVALTSNQKEALARFHTRRLIGQCRRGKERNAKGYELSMRLLDLGFTREEAVPWMEEFQRDVPSKDHPYTLEEALASLGSASSEKREPPWIPEGFFRVDPRTGELTDRELLTEQISQKLLEYHLSDAGNAESFVELSGDSFCFIKEKGKWFIWDGVRWVDDDEEVQLKMLETTRIRNRLSSSIEDVTRRQKFQSWSNSSESHFRVRAALNFAQLYLSRKFIEFDMEPFILCCENGIVNLRTGEFRQSTHSDWVLKSTGVAYDRDARCPRWIRFLNEIFQGNEELVRFIKRAIGYTLTGDVSEQGLFLCHGEGANGKTVLFDIIGSLLGEGEYSQTSPSSTFKTMKYEGNNATPDIARMAGARLIKSAEMKEKITLDTERIKALTGGDRIPARFLFRETFEFSPQFKIWIAVNHLPIVNDTSIAIWRRIHKIPFKAYFPPGIGDPNLTSTLKGELSGILNWAIEGCLEWQRDRLNPPEVVRNATNEYRQESDAVGKFLRDVTKPNPDEQVRCGVLYDKFKKWCENQGENPLTQKDFAGEMERKGYQKRKREDANYWVGLTPWT